MSPGWHLQNILRLHHPPGIEPLAGRPRCQSCRLPSPGRRSDREAWYQFSALLTEKGEGDMEALLLMAPFSSSGLARTAEATHSDRTHACLWQSLSPALVDHKELQALNRIAARKPTAASGPQCHLNFLPRLLSAKAKGPVQSQAKTMWSWRLLVVQDVLCVASSRRHFAMGRQRKDEALRQHQPQRADRKKGWSPKATSAAMGRKRKDEALRQHQPQRADRKRGWSPKASSVAKGRKRRDEALRQHQPQWADRKRDEALRQHQPQRAEREGMRP